MSKNSKAKNIINKALELVSLVETDPALKNLVSLEELSNTRSCLNMVRAGIVVKVVDLGPVNI